MEDHAQTPDSAPAILPLKFEADRGASLVFLGLGIAGVLFFTLWSIFPDMIALPELAEREGGRRRGLVNNLRNLYSAMSDGKSFGLPLLAALCGYMVVHNLVRYLRPASVTVDEGGIEVVRLRSRRHYPWTSVGEFRITKRLDFGSRENTLGFKNTDSRVPGLVKFPEEFGQEPEFLMALMEAARAEAAAGFDTAFRPRDAWDTTTATATATATATVSETMKTTTPSLVRAQDDWQPPSETDFAVRDERPPYGRYALYAVLLSLVAGGGIWVASQVVVNDELPDTTARIDLPEEAPSEARELGADEAAWVAALERDTLQGYRDYLEEFPDGRFREEAQEQIDNFDNEAWAIAQEADSVRGYEDYIEAWENGLHVDEARSRIAEIKAAEDARERAAREAREAERRAWNKASAADTVASYQEYLNTYPGGPNAEAARARIAALEASTADQAAWDAARAANRADSYQQYLNAFPQGRYAAEAIAAIERLRPSVGRTFSDCDSCPDMMVLPAGSDVLGAPQTDAQARSNEGPARSVSFGSPFAIGVTEVTFAQYDACVAAGGCARRPSDKGWGRGSRPVINVSFADAEAYAQWLSSTTGQSYRIPSEAQYEYAARAGSDDALPGGSLQAVCAFANGANNETEVRWANTACTDPGVGRTLPVGTLSANGFGLRDMVGNVQEWTRDCNTLNLRDAPVDGGADARGSCGQRVVRGGSWFSGPEDMRFTARQMLRRGDRNDFTGFRVVRRID